MSTTENTWTMHGLMGKLPVELLAFVLGKLDVPSLGRVRAVCRGMRLLATDVSRGMSAIVTPKKMLLEIAYVYEPGTRDIGWFLGRMEFVHMPAALMSFIAAISSKCSRVELSVKRGDVPTLQALSEIHNLTHLGLENTAKAFDQQELADARINLPALETLEVLTIGKVRGVWKKVWLDEQLVKLVSGRRLKKVRVVNELGVVGNFLSGCGDAVTEIALISCPYVTVEVLQNMTRLHSLTSLDLSKCGQVNDQWAAVIEGMKTLTRVSLSGCMVSNEGVANIAGLTNLLDLDISDNGEISSESLEVLSTHALLRTLNVSETGVLTATDAMAIIPKLGTRSGILKLKVDGEIVREISEEQQRAMKDAHVILDSAWPIVYLDFRKK